jgi:hypothetical protein
MTQPRSTLDRDAVIARSRPTPDKQHISDSPKGISSDALEGANLHRPTLQMTHPRPIPGERLSHHSP